MIYIKFVKKCCLDEFNLIENYDKAINDTTQCWVLHHRKETDLGLSRQQLIDQNLYFNRPACELIFLTKAVHNNIHHKNKYVSEETRKKQSIVLKGKKAWNKGKKCGELSEEHKKKLSEANKGKVLSEETRNKMKESNKGKIKGRTSMWKDNIKKYIKPNDIQKYLDDGWVIGKPHV